MGCSCGWRSYPPFDPSRILSLQENIGGLLQKFPILCLWSIDLTSNKHCLLCSNWNKKEFDKRPRTLAEINNGRRVLLLLLHGGVGKVHGGLLSYYESHDGEEPSTDRTGWLIIQVFGTILQRMIFLNSITLFHMSRLQLTSVYCNRRRV